MLLTPYHPNAEPPCIVAMRLAGLVICAVLCFGPALAKEPQQAIATPPIASQDRNKDLAASDSYAHPMPVGDATRQLLQIQRSGQHASTHQRPMHSSVASKVYERYLDSFSHPIPEHFDTTVKDSSAR